jgi:integrase
MGRKPSRWTNLPKGMRARPRGQKIFYYLDTGEKPRRELPLGSDYVMAVQKWGELTSAKKPSDGVITVAYALGRYFLEVVPGKAPLTQKDNEQEKAWLLRFFNDPPAPLDAVQPQHIRQFMRWRAEQAKVAAAKRTPGKAIPATFGQVRANRAKALFSHVWNFARGEGMTALANPCTGVAGFKESGRETAPDSELFARVLAHSDRPLQFVLRLADIVGQRPADVRRMSEADIRDGVLHVRQGKTGARLRIETDGPLAQLLDEIRAYKREIGVHALALLVNEDGQPLGRDAIRSRFDKARAAAGVAKADFQIRDLRAKAATETDDAGGTRAAQALLGHTTEGMTAAYIRRKAGKKVSSIR